MPSSIDRRVATHSERHRCEGIIKKARVDGTNRCKFQAKTSIFAGSIRMRVCMRHKEPANATPADLPQRTGDPDKLRIGEPGADPKVVRISPALQRNECSICREALANNDILHAHATCIAKWTRAVRYNNYQRDWDLVRLQMNTAASKFVMSMAT